MHISSLSFILFLSLLSKFDINLHNIFFIPSLTSNDAKCLPYRVNGYLSHVVRLDITQNRYFIHIHNMHFNAYNLIMMITMIIQSPFRMVYIYFPEGVTQPSCTLLDTILPIGYNIEFTDNIIPPKSKVVSGRQNNKTQNK